MNPAPNAHSAKQGSLVALRYSTSILLCLLGLIGLQIGCTTKQYHRAADREVYKIIREGEQKVLGQNTGFNIETPYSQRGPQSISPQEIIDDRTQTNRRLLTIEDALDLAVHNSRRYQTEKERLYLTALTLSGERYQFGPRFAGGTMASLNRSSDREQFGSLSSDLSANQFLRTGGQLGAAVANDLLRYFTGDPRRQAISVVSVNLLQPLLRGFGRNNPAVESLTQAGRDVIYAVRNFSFFQNEFAVEIVNDYFNLLAQKDIVRNRYTNYLSRGQSTLRLEKRASDRERAIDVDQARQAELSAQNNYINAVASYRTALDQFKIKLGLPLDEQVKLKDETLTQLQQRGPLPLTLPRERAYRLAVQRQLEILNAIDQFEDSRRKIKVAANRLRADLNIFADARLESEAPTDYTNFDPDKVRSSAGIELNLPLDRLRERNSYRATVISFDSQLRSFSLTLDTLKDNIERGLRTLEQRQQNYEIQRNALAIADRRVRSATLLLQAGRAEVRDLVEAQDAQIAAQNAVTAALVDYQEALLRLLLDIGVLETGTPQFWLKDHLAAHFPSVAPAPPSTPSSTNRVIPPEEAF